VELAQRSDLIGRLAASGALEVEDRLDAQDGLTGDRILAGDRDLHPLSVHPAPLSRSCSRRGSCIGYAVLRGEKDPDALGAMGLL
jgi:hypothetical protein